MAKSYSFKALTTALRQRIEKTLQVLDDALHSSEPKERFWAVEQVLKRVKPEGKAEGEVAKPKRRSKSATYQAVSELSETELLERIQALLQTERGHE